MYVTAQEASILMSSKSPQVVRILYAVPVSPAPDMMM
jgi:hypothetical protein